MAPVFSSFLTITLCPQSLLTFIHDTISTGHFEGTLAFTEKDGRGKEGKGWGGIRGKGGEEKKKGGGGEGREGGEEGGGENGEVLMTAKMCSYK